MALQFREMVLGTVVSYAFSAGLTLFSRPTARGPVIHTAAEHKQHSALTRQGGVGDTASQELLKTGGFDRLSSFEWEYLVNNKGPSPYS